MKRPPSVDTGDECSGFCSAPLAAPAFSQSAHFSTICPDVAFSIMFAVSLIYEPFAPIQISSADRYIFLPAVIFTSCEAAKLIESFCACRSIGPLAA